MNKVYITGSSIICALGNNKEESIKKIEQINDSNYSTYLKENFEDTKYYRIKKDFDSHKEKF